jgi:hypothetical protein
MPAPYLEGARQFLVQPGQYWQHLVEDIQPGDEVVLPAGFHVPQVISGLRGTAGRPIYIRSRDRVPAAIAAAGGGLVLRDAEHVVVENLLFVNPDEAALTIEASMPGGRAGAVTVRQCEVRGTRGGPDQDGIRVVRASGVSVVGLRVEGWQDAAIEVDSSHAVWIRAFVATGNAPGEARRAIVAVRGDSSDVLVTSGSFSGGAKVGMDIGAASGGAPGTADPVPSNVRAEFCVFDGVGTPLLVRAASGVLLSRCTVHEPTDAIYDVPGGAVARRIHVDRCLALWTPGSLRTFSPHGPDVPEDAVTLGSNVWFSIELPTAWEAIGRPFGTLQGEQRTDTDPNLVPGSLKPGNPAVAGFGAY